MLVLRDRRVGRVTTAVAVLSIAVLLFGVAGVLTDRSRRFRR